MEVGELWVSTWNSSPYLADGGSWWVVKKETHTDDKGPPPIHSSKAHWIVYYSGVMSLHLTPQNMSLYLRNPDDPGWIPRVRNTCFHYGKRSLRFMPTGRVNPEVKWYPYSAPNIPGPSLGHVICPLWPTPSRFGAHPPFKGHLFS